MEIKIQTNIIVKKKKSETKVTLKLNKLNK